jgi:hypothetical protein
MSLSPDQLEVTSFATTSAVSPVQPYTQAVGCYSPLCMPTMLANQCPETGTITG